jgi:hypothetical protein
MLFNFSLKPLAEVTPWGGREAPTLHWFGLTEGAYWIEAGAVRIFEYSAAAGGGRCDYHVARLHEDVLAEARHGLEPVPDDLRAYFLAVSGACGVRTGAADFSRKLDRLRRRGPDDDERLWDCVDRATDWVRRRHLDTAYLTAGPALAIWSDTRRTHLAWNTDGCVIDGVPAWSARSGDYSLSRDEYVHELTDFHARLMTAMHARVEAVRRGALAPGIAVDLDALAREQDNRRREIDDALRPPEPPTDWAAVRAAIRFIQSRAS